MSPSDFRQLRHTWKVELTLVPAQTRLTGPLCTALLHHQYNTGAAHDGSLFPSVRGSEHTPSSHVHGEHLIALRATELFCGLGRSYGHRDWKHLAAHHAVGSALSGELDDAAFWQVATAVEAQGLRANSSRSLS